MKKWCHNGNPFVFVDSFIIREETWGYKKKEELSFPIFIIYSLADKRKMSPANVYKILNSTMCFIRRVLVAAKCSTQIKTGFLSKKR